MNDKVANKLDDLDHGAVDDRTTQDNQHRETMAAINALIQEVRILNARLPRTEHVVKDATGTATIKASQDLGGHIDKLTEAIIELPLKKKLTLKEKVKHIFKK